MVRFGPESPIFKHTILEFSRSAMHTSLLDKIVKPCGILNEIQSMKK